MNILALLEHPDGAIAIKRLNKANHSVLCISDYESYLAHISKRRFDVILCQANFKGRHPYNLLNETRVSTIQGDVPFICCEISEPCSRPVNFLSQLQALGGQGLIERKAFLGRNIVNHIYRRLSNAVAQPYSVVTTKLDESYLPQKETAIAEILRTNV